MTAPRKVLAAVLASALGAVPQDAAAQPKAPAATDTAPKETIVDRAVVRFYSPETGGAERPRFVTARLLAFEARLVAMGEAGGPVTVPIDERHVRAALDHHIAEELLANLPLQRQPTRTEVLGLIEDTRADFASRVGGTNALQSALAQEGVDTAELELLVLRRVRAAMYVDHALVSILHPSDDQLREVFRTAAHPYRGKVYEAVKSELLRWFTFERLRVTESTFLQQAKSRVKVTFLPR